MINVATRTVTCVIYICLDNGFPGGGVQMEQFAGSQAEQETLKLNQMVR